MIKGTVVAIKAANNNDDLTEEGIWTAFAMAISDIVNKRRQGRSNKYLSRGKDEAEFKKQYMKYLEDAEKEGIVVVAPAGNNGPGSINSYPALLGKETSLIVVSSHDPYGKASSLSRTGLDVVYALGECADADVSGVDASFVYSGTSFAAPVVSGLVGYLMSLPSVREELGLDDMSSQASWSAKMKKKVLDLAREGYGLPIVYDGAANLGSFWLPTVTNPPQKSVIIFQEILSHKLCQESTSSLAGAFSTSTARSPSSASSDSFSSSTATSRSSSSTSTPNQAAAGTNANVNSGCILINGSSVCAPQTAISIDVGVAGQDNNTTLVANPITRTSSNHPPGLSATTVTSNRMVCVLVEGSTDPQCRPESIPTNPPLSASTVTSNGMVCVLVEGSTDPQCRPESTLTPNPAGTNIVRFLGINLVKRVLLITRSASSMSTPAVS
ncbi:Peptidase S8/S53 domain containing protein [Elaphomyces granulatus]